MASLLDTSFLAQGSPIFAFLLVFFLVYALLSSTKLMDLHRLPKGVIAFCIAILTLFSPAVTNTIVGAIPWFALIIFFLVFLLLSMMAIGVTQKDMASTLANPAYGPGIKNTIVVVAFIIIIAVAASQFTLFTGESSSSGNTTNSGSDITTVSGVAQGDVNDKGADALLAILFSPKILGFIAVMLIATMAAMFLSSNVK